MRSTCSALKQGEGRTRANGIQPDTDTAGKRQSGVCGQSGRKVLTLVLLAPAINIAVIHYRLLSLLSTLICKPSSRIRKNIMQAHKMRLLEHEQSIITTNSITATTTIFFHLPLCHFYARPV